MVTKKEVAKLLAFISAIYPNVDLRDGTAEAWYELLQDLPFDLALAATKKVLSEQEFPGLPAVGKIRQAVATIMTSDVPSAAQAWGMVVQAIKRYGYYRQDEALETLPERVREAVRCIGWQELCLSTEPEIVRAQFMRIYEQYAAREKQEYSVPAEVRALTARIAQQKALGGGKVVALPKAGEK
ncbi:MAG: replicative helicase loader/inhibitor [Moorellaceae bacterium]